MSGEARRPRIFLGIPCYGEVGPEILEDYMRFAFHLGRRLPQYDFELGIRTKAEQFRARNQIVDGAIQTDCDWLLMLDDDMVINPNQTMGPTDAYGFLERLIGHDKDLCGILYWQKGGQCPPVAMMKHGDRGYRFLRDDEITGGLQRVDVAGGGCLLVKTKVFDRLVHPYFGPEFEYGTDVQLCRQAAEKGFEVWIDSGIEFGHLKPERSIITSRTRHQHQLTNQMPGESQQRFVTSQVYDDLLKDAIAYTGYTSLDEMATNGSRFLLERQAFKEAGGTDTAWYRTHGMERIARQVWFNTANRHKREMTEYVINSVSHQPQDILDFGCGIGLPAFVLAQKGHRVTAMDIAQTETLRFLEQRAQLHRVLINIRGVQESRRALLPDSVFDVIIAMDCLEHIPDWRGTLQMLAEHLREGGVLFCNNAVLQDDLHQEHYPLDNTDFLSACLDLKLLPFNQLTYVKRTQKAAHQMTESEASGKALARA